MIDHHVFLRGGIGNQFFQWVYAKYLQGNGYNVKLNTTFLKVRKMNQTSGQLELTRLISSLGVPISSWKYLSSLEYPLKKLGFLIGIIEDDHLAESNQKSFRRFHYGYYQTYKFLNESIISQTKQLLHAELLKSDIQGRYCVLHVRAGDYLSNRYCFTYMGVLSVDYHVCAGIYLLGKYPKNKLIIVSDNEHISRLVLNELKKTYRDRVSLLSTVIGRSEQQTDAIKTMLSAEAISISNSSFSAMCAIVGKAGEVLFPHPWFRSHDLNHILPALKHWTKQVAKFTV
jgi:hypothetical protein